MFYHSSGGRRSKVKGPAGLVSPEASPLGMRTAAFSLCPHAGLPLCTRSSGVLPCVQMSSCEDTSHIRVGPTQTASFSLNHLIISKYSHILRY